MSSGESNQDLLETVHKLLGSSLIVTMTDGRTAQGKFVSLDRLGSIVLEDVVEKREIAYCFEDEGRESVYKWDTERKLSMAVIKGDRLAKVQIAKDEYQSRVGMLDV